MKKMIVMLVLVVGFGAFAWCPPPPPPCWGRPGNNGLANAAMITDIVANGIAIANGLFGGPVAVPAPVAVAPAVVPAPVAVAPAAVPCVVPPVRTPVMPYVRMNGVTIPVVPGY